MPIHLIRLRKAWECEDLTSSMVRHQRLDLPLSDPSEILLPARVRLTRTFAAPRLIAGRESLSIRLERVAGLGSILLNGQSVPVPEPLPDSFEFAVVDPQTRNRLVLEVDFDRNQLQSSPETAEWGRIALVISSVDSVGN